MRLTKYRLRSRYAHIKASLFVMLFYLFLMGGYIVFESTGDNLYHFFVNGTEVGTVTDVSLAEKMVLDARKEIAAQSDELVFMEVETSYEGEELLWGEYDKEEQVKENILAVLQSSIMETVKRSYTVKINEYMVNFSTAQDVVELLQTAIEPYDAEKAFDVELHRDYGREFKVLNVQVVDRSEEKADLEEEKYAFFPIGGVQETFAELLAQDIVKEEMDFEDYQLGVTKISFPQQIEIAESYLPLSQLKTVEQAVNELLVDQELQQVYEVVSGDTLSEIAIKLDTPMQTIVDMNESLESVNSTLSVGQKLIITIPEPKFAVQREEVIYSEEIYNAEVEYIDVDTWYTTQTEVIQQPSAGFRKIVAKETYINDKKISQEILKEELVLEAVPKIVKRGTKTPPTYIKPLSGGRKSSGFGPRKAPTKGASTYHKGLDWATPTGTPIVASCGGTVAKAGWGSGYGYVVYINHEDGRQTRYAHLSKVQVKVGQKVKQGQQIALSGNTGITSGPHLHFEILIGGKQVNPEKYLK